MAPSFTGEVGEAPRVVTMHARHAAEANAATDFKEAIWLAPFDGTITAANFTPDAAMTGATSTAATFNVRNETQTLVAATLAFITGTDLVAYTVKALTVSGTAANVVVAAGDVITFQKTHASTGTAGPAGTVSVTISRNDVL